MKKLGLGLLVSVFTIGTTQATLKTGFYLGIHGGYGSTTGKNDNSDPNNTTGSTDMGRDGGNIGIHGGYGWITGCIYYGGELAYTFEHARIRDGQIAANTPNNSNGLELKRSGYANIALRGGYLFTPSTMIYLRLGGNLGRWKIRDAFPDFTNFNQGTGTNTSFDIAPGFGMETVIMPCVYFRTEYVYEFGPSVRATNANVPGYSSEVGKIRVQSIKVGFSFKL